MPHVFSKLHYTTQCVHSCTYITAASGNCDGLPVTLY